MNEYSYCIHPCDTYEDGRCFPVGEEDPDYPGKLYVEFAHTEANAFAQLLYRLIADRITARYISLLATRKQTLPGS